MKDRLLCIDVGNTNIVLGVADDQRILESWRIRTDMNVTADELGSLIINLFNVSKINVNDIGNVIISCVVPPILNPIRLFCRRYLMSVPMIVGEGINTGMTIDYDNKKEVGADRIVNAVAAYEKYRTGLIIIDFGTATTFDCVSKDGIWLGGAISPGVTISCEGLYRKAFKLPCTDFYTRPESVIGKNTISSMNAGIIFGYAGLVDGIVRRMKREIGYGLKVIATGGLAGVISAEAETIDHVDEFLTLEGLRIIFKRNM
ncbi:MAG: type III pantothenate kinase [Deltaproteobacteria bacterium]|nr:type III pantothenate kinase [Deltaproteobacteria bacterium]